MGKLIRWLIVVLFVAGIGFFIWQKTRSKPVEVVVRPITRGTVENVVANTRAGTVDACRRARLSPSIGGQIASLPIKEGDLVEAGDLLLEIWNEDLNAQVAVAQQEVKISSAQAEAACVSAEEAARQGERAKTLFRGNAGSLEQMERLVAEAESMQAKCEAARVTVQRNMAQVSLAKANLARSRLEAPFAGVIAKIEGELNEYVTPSPIGVPTPPAVDLIENDCFYVTAPIDEVDAAGVRIGMDAGITLDAFRNRVFSGTVRRIAPYVLDFEKQARTVDIEVSFAGKDVFAELLAGYSADVEIILSVSQDTLKVPTEAVVEDGSVYVFYREEGIVRKVAFTPGLRNWSVTEAVSGLREGQLVVVNVDKPGLADNVAAVQAEPEP